MIGSQAELDQLNKILKQFTNTQTAATNILKYCTNGIGWLTPLIDGFVLEGTPDPEPAMPTWTTKDGKFYFEGKVFEPRFINIHGWQTCFGFNGIWGPNTLENFIDAAKAAGFNGMRAAANSLCVRDSTRAFQPFIQSGSWWPPAYPSDVNAKYRTMTYLQVLDDLVATCEAKKFPIILDLFHDFVGALPTPYPWGQQWANPITNSGSGFTMDEWVACHAFFADRYKANKYVMGYMPDNEPYGDIHFYPSSKTGYLEGSSTNWSQCMRKVFQAINAANPNVLVGIQGIDTPGPNAAWGETFEQWTQDASTRIAELNEQAFYEFHHYGPGIGSTKPYCNDANFPANLPAVCDAMFGFLQSEGKAIFAGEWGFPSSPTTLSNTHDQAFLDYMVSRKIAGSFWAASNSADTISLWEGNLTTPVVNNTALVSKLAPWLAQATVL